MKSDLYTKIVLSVIALALVIIAFRGINPIPKVLAEPPIKTSASEIKYALLPVNPDGSVDINIKSIPFTETVEVKLTDFPYEDLRIDLSEISTSDELRIENVE